MRFAENVRKQQLFVAGRVANALRAAIRDDVLREILDVIILIISELKYLISGLLSKR